MSLRKPDLDSQFRSYPDARIVFLAPIVLLARNGVQPLRLVLVVSVPKEGQTTAPSPSMGEGSG